MSTNVSNPKTKKSTRRIRRVLDAKYEKSDLNEVMTKQYQTYLTTTERNRLLHLLNKFEDLFDGTLDTWNNTPV